MMSAASQRLWPVANAAAQQVCQTAARVGLVVWHLSGPRPALIFTAVLVSMVGGLYATILAADAIWNHWLFPPARLAALAQDRPALAFVAAAIPVAFKALLAFQFLAVSAMFWVWLERKISARIQSRLGPMHTGGWHGWSQSLADGIKLLGKEDLTPARADAAVFRLAPALTVAGAALGFATLPWGLTPASAPVDLNVGLFVILAAGAVEVVGVLLAGWASASQWSLFGGLRAAVQMVVCEVPLGLALLAPLLYAGSLRLTAIADAQAGPVWNWLVFRDPFCALSLGVFLTAGLAACKRAPFDLAEAESELVGGFHTEYSGLRWVFFFMAEYAAMWLVSATAAIVWLGGGHTGVMPHRVWPALSGDATLVDATRADAMPADAMLADTTGGGLSVVALAAYGAWLAAPLVLVAKASAIMVLQMWLRWTLPRLRLDQVVALGLKTLLPLALVATVGTALWVIIVAPAPAAVGWLASEQTALQRGVDVATRLALLTAAAALLIWLTATAVASRRRAHRDQAAFGTAWHTWGGRATSDDWSVGYAWHDPAHRKPLPPASPPRTS